MLIQKASGKYLNNYAILRFFNVTGAQSVSMREKFGDNIFPQISAAIEKKIPFKIYGKIIKQLTEHAFEIV